MVAYMKLPNKHFVVACMAIRNLSSSHSCWCFPGLDRRKVPLYSNIFKTYYRSISFSFRQMNLEFTEKVIEQMERDLTDDNSTVEPSWCPVFINDVLFSGWVRITSRLPDKCSIGCMRTVPYPFSQNLALLFDSLGLVFTLWKGWSLDNELPLVRGKSSVMICKAANRIALRAISIVTMKLTNQI